MNESVFKIVNELELTVKSIYMSKPEVHINLGSLPINKEQDYFIEHVLKPIKSRIEAGDAKQKEGVLDGTQIQLLEKLKDHYNRLQLFSHHITELMYMHALFVGQAENLERFYYDQFKDAENKSHPMILSILETRMAESSKLSAYYQSKEQLITNPVNN